ncbi:MAG: rhodanese-like domain-containing protein [Candidatus Latescibacteria bacterium]|jgi:rhodanese-related sulfurtransferase|nr:rhodanese-like domain-containing protein [Candidatus Latescibacterota bacterium]
MITRITIRSATIVLLISFIFLSGCKDSNKTINEPNYEDITAQEAFSLIQDNKENKNFVILDVRTPEEYASGHLENAVNINFNSPSFQESLSTLDKNNSYLIYCRTGMRSSNAFEMMKSLGFNMVSNMSGGIIEWENNGLPTVK